MTTSAQANSSGFAPVQEHELLRATLRQFFADRWPLSRVKALDAKRTVPRKLWHELAELGVPGLPVPTKYGGEGADLITTAVAIEEVGRAWASAASDFVLIGMTARLLVEFGSEEQRARLLPGVVRGRTWMAFGMTEPSGGTDLLGLRTTARRDGDGWVINGQKVYTSRADQAQYIVVLARTAELDPDHKARGFTLLLTPTNQPGVTVRKLKLMGIRSGGASEVFFDDARAPADAVIGREGRGFHQLLASINNERITSSAMQLGVAVAAFEESLRYSLQRTAFGRPIGQFQALQHYIAEMAIDIEATRLLIHKAAWLQDAGLDCSMVAAMAKVAAGETAVKTTDRGMRILAGHGLTEDSPMERYLRDARIAPFSPVSGEMGRNYIGEQLGLPKSY